MDDKNKPPQKPQITPPPAGKNGEKPKIDPELLMAMLQQQAKAGGKGGMPGIPGAAPKKKFKVPTLKEAVSKFLNTLAKSITSIDRLINFVTKPTDSDRNEIVQAARSPILFGFYIITFFVVFGGLWAGCAPLDSAATAIGTVIAKSKRQEIQHREGGIVTDIFVKQGDAVKAGEPLVKLSDIKTKAHYDNALNSYNAFLANENRLFAERDELDDIKFDDFLLAKKDHPTIAKLLQTQRNLFKAKRATYTKSLEKYEQDIIAAQDRLQGLQSSLATAQYAAEYKKTRLAQSQELFKKGFIHQDQIQQLELDASNAESQLHKLESDIHQAQAQYKAAEVVLLTQKADAMSRILTELRETQQKTDNAELNYIETKDELDRTLITSPVDGVVNKIVVTTTGAVVNPGSLVAEVSPINDELVVEAKIPHKEIQSIIVGQTAKMRFSAFKSRTSPVFEGKVVSLSPDTVEDKMAAAQFPNPMMAQDGKFYVAIIELDMEEFKRIADKKGFALHPGMQAEVQIIRGSRTLLKYLLDPVLDTMFNALKEK